MGFFTTSPKIKPTNFKRYKIWLLGWFLNCPNSAMLPPYSSSYTGSLFHTVLSLKSCCTLSRVFIIWLRLICDMFNVKSSQYKCRSANIVEDIQFHFGEVSKPIESQEVMYLQVPKVSRVNFEERSIVVAGPKLWNKLPMQLRTLTELEDFKKQLKTYLFKQAHQL